MNIYFHLFGVISFAIFLIFVYIEIYNHYIITQISNIFVFAVFFLRMVLCFFFSGLFYIFYNYSEKIIIFWNRLDYLEIVILI
jgi:predicted membrane channel-forming protein YqfA (hemolysin III family)